MEEADNPRAPGTSQNLVLAQTLGDTKKVSSQEAWWGTHKVPGTGKRS